MTSSAPPRAPGRPRDPERDAAILAASLDLLAERGVAGTTVEAVAARAGVGKATVYRRWASREALIVDAVASVTAPLPVPDLGSVRADLLQMLSAVGRRKPDSTERLLPRLLGEGGRNPELLRNLREHVIEPRRARFREVLQRGVARAELRADLDLELAVDLLVAPVLYRRMIDGISGELPPAALAGLVDVVLSGISAEGT